MQVRGAMSQKELAEQTDVGISTMSRFLSQKSTELNPQLIAKITAKLNIPLHEMIDFVEEDFADRFIRLVKFYKDELKEEDIDANNLLILLLIRPLRKLRTQHLEELLMSQKSRRPKK